jgi:subtilisin family serine protease
MVSRNRSALAVTAGVLSALAWLERPAPGGAQTGGARDSVGIVVRLSEPPVARYAGGTAGLAPTSVERTGGGRLDARSHAVASYRAYLAKRQDAFVAAARAVVPEAKLLHRYQMVLGGVALRVPAGAVRAIGALPGVVAVYPDVLRQLATDRSPAFIGAKGAWKDLGGQGSAGEGVIVGVLDTGIWPEHPSFSDPDPAGNAYPPPAVPHQCQFDIGANPGPDFACNKKLIGAFRFLAAYDACVGAGECTMPAAAFTSARDENGHGTHTASTAAGNGQVPATLLGIDRGDVSGIAPRAKVIAYKVCGEDGCFASDSAAAVDQAILDGVDVINYSVGGGTAPYADVAELAFLDAYAAGIFVAASAGNDGPLGETVEHRGPWVTTVAASTQKREFTSTLTLASSDGTKLKVEGASVTGGIAPPLPVFDAAVTGDAGCELGPPDGAFLGKVVLCQRGPGRLQRSFNVAQRGGVGMILYNAVLQGRATDNHTIPTVNLEYDAGAAVRDFVSLHPDVVASFTPGKARRGVADLMAPFSSRGGPLQPLGTSKPDITAPGMQILAGNTPDSVTLTDVDDQLFQAIQGTSMSSPHVAGAAALVRALHPSFTPGQIKSALMTLGSAKKLFDEDGTTPFDPFDAGAGRLAIKKAADVPITFDATAADFQAHAGDLWNANTPSLFLPHVASTVSVTRTARSVLAGPKTLKLKVEAPDDLAVTVPPVITVPAGGDTAFSIDVDVSAVPEGEVRHAAIVFRGGRAKLRFPITVRKISGTTTLYGGNGGGATAVPGGVVVLDQAVGTGTLLGDPVTPGWFTGIAFTSTGLLYGTTNEGGPSSLVRIDPNTGGLVATIGPITDDPFFGGAVSIGDLAVQPGTDVLFGIRWNGDGAGLGGYLYTIDPVTAVATLVGDTGTCTEGGLAFAPNGTLYFTGYSDCSFVEKSLHVLNPATGAIVSSIPLNGFYESLAVRPTDGALFASAGSGSLYEIDPATGVEVNWGETGTGVLADLAFR